MKRNLLILSGLFILALSFAATAHPLGNFSVNQYSRLEVEKTKINLRQILDLAEIPTFQMQSEIDADKNGTLSADELNVYADKLTPEILSKLSLMLDDQPLALRAESKSVALHEGAGNLPTLRLEWNFAADTEASGAVGKVAFENKNFAGRLGWNEIVVTRARGVNVFDSSAYGSGASDELKAYPADDLGAPLAERAARFSFSTGAVPENAKPLADRDGHPAAAVQKDRLAELINVPEITPALALLGMLFAFALGATHALSPGHGKTVVGAYLVGSRGTPKHAAFLGLTVTITHTLGVFALGAAMLFASNYVMPEKLMPFLSFVSGLLVLYIGLAMFKTRLFSALGWQTDADHHHDHSHENSRDHAHHDDAGEHAHGALTHTHDGHTHSHLPPDEISWKSLLALGISGGLLPCPSALVLMLSAISLGRTAYGLVLTTAFSLGLAATLTAVGLIFLSVGKLFGGARFSENRIVRTLPVASAFVIACVGAVICYNSVA